MNVAIRSVYALLGAVLLGAGVAVLLFNTGLLPEGIKAALFDEAGGNLTALHIAQEAGTLLVFAGLITFWFAWHYGQSLYFHAAMTVLLGLVFGPALTAGSLWLVFATLAAAMTIMGYAYGPLGAWLPTLFPVQVRYSGVSVAFNTGGIIGGAVTPILAQLMAAEGWGAQAGLLLSAAGVVTLLGVTLARPSAEAG